jgi:2-polyprenyl-6-methoxyphenol hydroxylase-like FAD-dependent oxidoreductase
LIVIGGGSAGFAAAIKGAELGYNVALVEADTIVLSSRPLRPRDLRDDYYSRNRRNT